MARNLNVSSRDRSPQNQEPPTFQVPLSIILKARLRRSQQDTRDNNSPKDENEEEEEEEFRTLQYPAKPWGRASRYQSTTIAPSRRLISSLIEDAEAATESSGTAHTSRTLRSRGGGKRHRSRRVSLLLLKRSRSPSSASISNVTESSDDNKTTFRERRSRASSIKKPPSKQQKLQDSTSTSATMQTTPQKSNPTHNLTRSRRTAVIPKYVSVSKDVKVASMDVDGSEDEAVAMNDSANNTSESDYTPRGRTISPQQQQQERLTRTRLRNILRADEDEGQAVASQQQQGRGQKQEKEQGRGQGPEQELELEQQAEEPPYGSDEAAKLLELKEHARSVEQMEYILIPTIDLLDKPSVLGKPSEEVQSAPKTDAGRLTKDVNPKEAEKGDEKYYEPRTTRTTPKDTTSVIRDMHLATTLSARPNAQRDTNTTPVVGVDTLRHTRSNARKLSIGKLESPSAAADKTTTPSVSQKIAQEHKDNLRHVNVVETPEKAVTIMDPPHKAIKQIETPRVPVPAELRAKVFHGWWLKRKDGFAQEGNAGIIVQGNMLEPKAIMWHTSTIKDAPEPMLVMTFSGSFYRLSGSIDVQRMDSNGFSKEVIEAFKNGFPADWKSILSKDDGKKAISSIPSGKGKEMSNNSGKDATTQNTNGQQRQESPLLQRVKESAQRARQPPKQQVKPTAQQVRQTIQQVRQLTQQVEPAVLQLMQATQQEGRTVVGSRPETEAASVIKETPRRTASIPTGRALVQTELVSSLVQSSTPARPASRTPVQREAIPFVIPPGPHSFISSMPGVPRETEAHSNEPSLGPESIPTNGPTLLKKAAATKKRVPAMVITPTVLKPPTLEVPTAQASMQIDSTPHQSSASRHLSTSDGTSLQSDDLALRRAPVPGGSIATGEPWKTSSQQPAVDRTLDGNLRMRSMAVVEQIREHTRQHVDLIVGLGDEGVHGPLVTATSHFQGLGGSSSTFAKSLSSISNSSHSTFDDID